MARTSNDYAIERMVFRNIGSELGLRAIEERAYIALLDGEDPVKIRAQLASVEKSHADRITFKAVYAFAMVKAGDPENGLAILERDKVNWTKEEPRWALVYAFVLRANRMRTPLLATIAQIEPTKLRGPERLLLQELTTAP
jgi:hypothetical protein